jgi:hypothetical protein
MSYLVEKKKEIEPLNRYCLAMETTDQKLIESLHPRPIVRVYCMYLRCLQ